MCSSDLPVEGAWRSIEDSAELNSDPGGQLKTSGHPDALKKPRLYPHWLS